jgi:hypothetical protein
VNQIQSGYPEHPYLPVHGIPITGVPAEAMYWNSTDNEEQYQETGGHPLYGPFDIVYRTNSHGYRAPEFHPAYDISIVAIGCSCTFGVGVRDAETYHQVFAARLGQELGRSVTCWNLALSGSSVDFVARTLHLSVPALQPHIVLALVPPPFRREFHAPDDVMHLHHPNWQPSFSCSETVGRTFDNLASENDNRLNLFRNFLSIQNLLRDRVFLFSFAYQTDPGPVSAYFDRKCWVDRWDGDFIDSARDHAHPGPRTHRRIADLFWDKFVATGGLSAMAEIPRPHPGPSTTPARCLAP